MVFDNFNQMDATIRTLYESGSFEVTDFVCQCTECGFSGVEYQSKFSICYIRRGSFLFKIYSDELECFNNRFLINKPGFTHRVKHYHGQADECLIIGFTTGFYDRIREAHGLSLTGFLTNNEIHSLLLNSSPETEYLIFRLKNKLTAKDHNSLEMDGLILDLIDKIFHLDDLKTTIVSEKHKRAWLPAIEKSREWVQENFAEEITMEQLARVSHMSPFHFNRVFKQITRVSPYQYLLNFRMHHASHLLKTTNEPVSDIGWSVGFNSPDHFSYAFKSVNGFSPQHFRKINKQEF
jgi:AraC family transcriptional regulator